MALSSAADLSFSDCSIMATILSYLLSPLRRATFIRHSPSSSTVPAYTVAPGPFALGTGSPVRDASFMLTSPSSMVPSKGIMPPMRTTIRSSSLIFPMGTSTSPSSVQSHTLSIFKDMLLARSLADFLWVHSSKSSPSLNRNITDPAVLWSPLMMEMPMESPSSISTCIFRLNTHLRPLITYGTALRVCHAAFTAGGKTTALTALMATMFTSFSSYSRLSDLSPQESVFTFPTELFRSKSFSSSRILSLSPL